MTSASELSFSNAPFLIMSPGGVRLAGELANVTGEEGDADVTGEEGDADVTGEEGDADVTGEEGDIVRIALAAPEEIGDFTWHFVIPEHERKGKVCQQASLPFTFRTRPHVTSLAVWDCPSPVVIGETFRLKVGAQCSASCAALRGSKIEIRDAMDAVMATVPLGATPWLETNALYWAEVDLTAPGTVGLHSWTVKFSSAQLHPPHDEATFSFSLIADRPPEHTVTVQVVEEQTGTPIEDAQVRLGAYRLSTDAMGLARFTVPKGEHELLFWRAGYEAPPRTIDVRGDARIQIEAKVLPVVNPDLYWQG